MDLSLGVGGWVWVGLSASGGIVGVCLAVVLLLEHAVGAGVWLRKRVLGAGFVRLGGLRSLRLRMARACLSETEIVFITEND